MTDVSGGWRYKSHRDGPRACHREVFFSAVLLFEDLVFMTHDTHKSHDLRVVTCSLAQHNMNFTVRGAVSRPDWLGSNPTSQCRVAVSYSLLVSSQVCDGVKYSLWHMIGKKANGLGCGGGNKEKMKGF